MWIYDFAFCYEFRKMSQIYVFKGVRPDYYIVAVIEIYHKITWGVFPIYYNITMGGGLSGPRICIT